MPENLAKFCPGCGYPIILLGMHRILKELGVDRSAAMGLDIGCALLGWNYLPINTFQTHHGRVVPVMVGSKNADKNMTAIAITGDGGAYAIGWQYLCHAARRDDPITVVVVNNSVYGMTGGQTAPTTLCGQKTVTSPMGATEKEFTGPEYLRPMAHSEAFIARTAVNEPQKMFEYFKKAFAAQSAGHFSLIEILSFCPTNWRTQGAATLAYLDRMRAVFQTGEI